MPIGHQHPQPSPHEEPENGVEEYWLGQCRASGGEHERATPRHEKQRAREVETITQPGKPAFGELVALRRGETTFPSEELPRVPPQDAHTAVRPPKSLLRIGFERIGHQTASERVVKVEALVTRRQQAEPGLGILADAPLRPAAKRFERALPDKCHRAVLDDRIALLRCTIPIRKNPEYSSLAMR